MHEEKESLWGSSKTTDNGKKYFVEFELGMVRPLMKTVLTFATFFGEAKYTWIWEIEN
jgi:hypothetical protein